MLPLRPWAARLPGTAALLGVLVTAAPALGWQTDLDSGPFEPLAPAFVHGAVDPDGHVLLLEAYRSDRAAVRKLVPTTGFVLWERHLTGAGTGRVVTDGQGDVLVGTITGTGGNRSWYVAKLSGEDGVRRWRRETLTQGNPDDGIDLHALAADAAGDVVLAGFFDVGGDENTTDKEFAVQKLAGDTGEERWLRILSGAPPPDPNDPYRGSNDVAAGVAVAGGDLVVAVGVMAGEFVVIAFAGDDGTEQWRYTLPGAGQAVQIAGNGDIIAAGISGDDVVLMRLDAAGNEVWQRALHAAPSFRRGPAVRGLTFDPGGDVVVGSRGPDDREVVTVLGGADGVVRWQRDVDAAPLGVLEIGKVVADAAGDVLVLGGAPAVFPALSEWTVTKLAALDGGLLWTQPVPDGGASALLLSRDAYVVTAGTTGTPSGRDATVVALAADSGTLHWRDDVAREETIDDRAYAVAFAPDGDVVAAGELGFEYAIAKLAGGGGRERWRRTFGRGRFTALVLAADGDVVAAGRHSGVTRVIRLDAAGTERWRTDLERSGHEPGVLETRAGDVVTFTHEAVVALDGATGDERWRFDIDGTPTVSWNVLALAADGDVLAAGSARFPDATGAFRARQPAIFKLDAATGAEHWRYVPPQLVPQGEFGRGFVEALTTDGAGDLVAVGRFTNPATGRDALVVKVAGTDGSELWRQFLAVGKGDSVAVTDDDDVIVGAHTDRPVNEVEAFVALLAGADGAERWRREILGDATARERLGSTLVTRVGVDGRGNVLAATFVGSAVTQVDLAVVKLAGWNGRELWRRTVDGTTPDEELIDDPSDWASGMALDARGNVAVSGVTANVATGEDFTVLRFGGRRGAPWPAGPVGACQRVLARAGARLQRGRLRDLERCAEAQSADERVECADQHGAPLLERVRRSVARRCGMQELGELNLCGVSVPTLLGASGCFVAAHHAAVDAVFALPMQETPTDRPTRRCLDQVRTAVVRDLAATLGIRQRCREKGCDGAALARARTGRLTARVGAACGEPAALTHACAPTADGLARCLRRADDATAAMLVDAQYDPRPRW